MTVFEGVFEDLSEANEEVQSISETLFDGWRDAKKGFEYRYHGVADRTPSTNFGLKYGLHAWSTPAKQLGVAIKGDEGEMHWMMVRRHSYYASNKRRDQHSSTKLFPRSHIPEC